MSDLIEREAVKSTFELHTGLSWDKLKVMFPMLADIDDLPAVDVSQPEGKSDDA